MAQLASRFIGTWLIAQGAVACGAHAASTPASPPTTPAVLELRAFPDGPPGRLRSHTLELPLELMLPGRARWDVSDGPSWLVAAHSPSGSLLALRTWRADRLVRRADCVAQAQLARPTIPIIHEEAVIERRPLAAPPGFDTELVVGVEPSPRGIGGYAIAIGASVGRCFAAVFTTTVDGAGADEEVAARLGVVVDRVLAGVRVRSVDERGAAARRRLVSSPPAIPE